MESEDDPAGGDFEFAVLLVFRGDVTGREVAGDFGELLGGDGGCAWLEDECGDGGADGDLEVGGGQGDGVAFSLDQDVLHHGERDAVADGADDLHGRLLEIVPRNGELHGCRHSSAWWPAD